MHLSLLSEGYVSDSFNDAGLLAPSPNAPVAGALHFVALCRGLVVLLALALPIGMTLLAKTTLDTDDHDEARFIAAHGAALRARNG